MELSTILIVLLLVSFVILTIVYFILSAGRPAALQGVSPKVGSMNKETIVGTINDSRDTFLAPAGATFMTYIYCAINNKTSSLTQDPITLFKFGSVTQLQLLPGGVSQPPKTRLLVRTQKDAGENEYIDLPMFPEQRWVHVAIVREGRRFTVYYNGEPVASKRVIYYPVINSSQLVIGNSRLAGEFALPRFASIPLTQEEIKEILAETSNTKYEPYKPMDILGSFASLGCPNGIFCFTINSQPTEFPMKTWSSPYA
jgi:hypothetical protein